jgi:hypothetical protein
MTRAISLTLVLLALTPALPAAAQDSGGLRLGSNPLATLNQIDADTSRGCALSSTSVTVGVNKAFGAGSSATQRLGTFAGSTATVDAGLWSAPRWQRASISVWGPVHGPLNRSMSKASVALWTPSASHAGSTWALAPGPLRTSAFRTCSTADLGLPGKGALP